MAKIWQKIEIEIETEADKELSLVFIDMGRGYYAIPLSGEGGVVTITKADNIKITMPTRPDVPPVPTSARYRLLLIQGVNIRSGAGTSFTKIGDLDYDQIVEIDNATEQGARFTWGKILSIENPTSTQAAMMLSAGEKWVAMRDGASVWLELIAEA